jgi:hypothetical protein
VDLRKLKEHSNLKVGSGPAVEGIVEGAIGFDPPVIMRRHLVANSASNATLRSPSYIEGGNLASSNFSDSTQESLVCTAANAITEGANTTLWIEGCRDGWAIALSNPSNLDSRGIA